MANQRSPGLSPIVLRKNLCGSARRYQLRNPVSLACERRARFARSSETRNLQRSLLHICFPGLFESTKTWSINSSISARGDWRGFCCCLGKSSRNQAGVPAEGEPVKLGGNGWYHPGQGK